MNFPWNKLGKAIAKLGIWLVENKEVVQDALDEVKKR